MKGRDVGLTKGVGKASVQLHKIWEKLDPSLRYKVAVGCEGHHNLMDLSSCAFQLYQVAESAKEKNMYFHLGLDFLLAAWECNPLNGELAIALENYINIIPSFQSDIGLIVRAVAAAAKRGREYLGDPQRMTEEEVVEKICRWRKEESFPLLLWERLFLLVYSYQNFELFNDLLQRSTWPGILERVRIRLLAMTSLGLNNTDKWVDYLIHQRGSFSYADRCFSMAQAAFQSGDRDRAVRLWRQGLLYRPWCSSVILKMYDVYKNIDQERSPLPGSIGICLYTYNKAADLEDTLSSLARSNLLGATIFVLINGCSDGTRDVARYWCDQLGAERIKVIDLPVNIGAPAARNWLWNHPEVQSKDWIVYLDDDVLVPSDWLFRFGAVVKQYHQGAVWGCRVVDAQIPAQVQSIDYHLLPPPDNSPVRFKLNVHHYETLDCGQFAYSRPCIHVTGCCHLFKRAKREGSVAFDLRFSPSQFDDVEQDIRSALSGMYAIYHGHLGIRHKNRTGKQSRFHIVQQGAAQANFYKLQTKYSREEYQKLIYWNRDIVERDILSKIREIENGVHV